MFMFTSESQDLNTKKRSKQGVWQPLVAVSLLFVPCQIQILCQIPQKKLQQVYQRIQEDAVVHVLQYAPITEELRSEVLTDQKALKEAGAFAFTNDGVGVKLLVRCTWR